MRHATIHLELVTPCFLGGADNRSAEWRAASIRGQLRWWFRAVAGGEYGGSLEKTKAAEAAVFGDTERRSTLKLRTLGTPASWPAGRTWRSGRRLNAREVMERSGLSPSDEPGVGERLQVMARRGDGSRYEVGTDPTQYLGYGCIGWNSQAHEVQLERACFEPGRPAVFRLQWARAGAGSLSEEHWNTLARALWAWIHLGGLGSRSRNGFGSVRCTGLEGNLPGVGELPFQPGLGEFEATARGLLRTALAAGTPAWTHLSPASRILLGTTRFHTWEEALCDAGAWVLSFRRRYGAPQDARKVAGSALANRDYVWTKQASGAGDVEGFPDEAGFGLPLMFDKQGASITWLPKTGEEGREDRRRASPLLIHIAKLGPQEHYPVLTCLPARLIPEEGELRFRRKVQGKYRLRDQPRGRVGQAHEGIVGHFLDRLEAQGVVREVSP